ncbi:MAG: polysaccharide biosynthesis tyrosine autokinase [Ectothiorhodospiraceae bacterium]|nr:polysaccharide biosynthesis tyrosine autokinase [Ectothiorhodospiraceae bacterium]MCH8504049.1 polysaccharide biosynthesis tyrosine autokinase [Ectothiorhodospiraceae bacterium]
MTDLFPPSERDETARVLTRSGPIGRQLVESGKLDAIELERITHYQQKTGLRFGEAAVALGLLTEEDVRIALAQQFSYALAPVADRRLAPSLVAANIPESREVEALRGLRSELLLRYFDGQHHRVLPLVGVDSGKATGELTANLAVVFSQVGALTLLIDANMRQPELHTLFGQDNVEGLSDVLAGRASVSPRLCTPLQSLWLLNAGTRAPNPQELLSGDRYRKLMSRLAEKFDVILVNTPSMSENVDAQLIAARAGAAVMVAREHVTSLGELDHARLRLQSVGVSVMGVALSH